MITKTHRSSADPIVWFAILFVLFLIVGTIATFLSIHQDKATGELQTPYYFTTKTQAIQPLELSLSPYSTLSMNSRTTILPAENGQGEFQGVVMIGEGMISLRIPGKDLHQYPVDQIYLPMNVDQWIDLESQNKASLSGPTVEEASSARELTNYRHYLTLSYNLFGYTRLYPKNVPFQSAVLYYYKDELFRLTHGENVQLESWGQGTLYRTYVGDSDYSLDLNKMNASRYSLTYITLFIVSIMALSLIFTFVTTAHFIKPNTPYRAMESPPNLFYLAVAFIGYITVNLFLDAASNVHAYAVIGCFYLLLVPTLIHRSSWKDITSYPTTLFTSIISAVILATGIQIISSLQIPSTWRWINDIDVALWVQTFFLVSLLQELYWRGILQTFFRDLFGSKMAIGLTALIMMIYSMISSFTAYGFSDFEEEVLQFGLLSPVYFLITAYFYERVRNVWASAVLHTLLLHLPKILVTL